MARKLIVEILGDASSLEKAFAKSSKQAQTFDKNISKTGKSAKTSSKLFGGLGKTAGLLGVGLGVGGLATAAKAAFDEFADAQKVTAQTQAVLKSTGGAANVTAQHVDALSQSLLNLSGQDDEVIKSGENMLLTFTNVRNEAGKGNDIFDQATKTALDMSTALGQDMRQSALQLGKALNDPIKGVTALRRVGVSFTKGQQDTIKHLVKTGHTLEAQKLILRELNKEFGGSAKAAGQTFAGQLNKLRNTLLNMGATIAQTLMPTIQKLLENLNKWLSNSKNQKQILDAVNSVIKALTTTVKVLSGAFRVLSTVTGGTKNAIYALIAAVIAFKALKLASTLTTIAGNLGLVAGNAGKAGTAMRGARASSVALNASFLGKAGLVVGAGAAAFALTTLFLKATHLDEKLKDLGGSVYDLGTKLGILNDPLKKAGGLTAPSPEAFAFMRRRLAALERSGLSPEQAAAEFARTHPGVARHDIDVTAGAVARTITINGGLHLHGVQNPKQLEDSLLKRTHQRANRRRGAR